MTQQATRHQPLRSPSRSSAHPDLVAPEPRLLPQQSSRLLRQLHALEMWNEFRRQRERHLMDVGGSRDAKLFASYELEGLRRTHAAVLSRVDVALRQAGDLTRAPSPTVVIAHRSPWFAARVGHVLEASGLQVLECTDHGADALGVIIAEQPDLVVISDRLVMASAAELVAQTQSYSPLTTVAVHAEEGPEAAFGGSGCLVFGSKQRPDEIANALRQQSHLAT